MKKNNRINVYPTLFAIFLVVIPAFFVQADTPNKPNILVILADDLGYGDLGYTGATDILTPNIDMLANNGVQITNGYVTHPYCGPSRAGLITGRYQARFGLEVNLTNSLVDHYAGLPTTETTFAKRLQPAGYQTGIIGKWHLGGSYPFHPNNRGFDYFYGFRAGGHSYFPKDTSTNKSMYVKNDIGGKADYGVNEGTYLPLERNSQSAEFDEYLTTALSKDAASFIAQSEKPFMLYLAYNAPHSPLEAPKATIAKYQHIKNPQRRIYAAMIDEMDQGIGLVIDTLKKTGKFDNTLIFFLSDNGGAASPGVTKIFGSYYSDSGPFRDGKGSMREGGSHVPFIVHWPAGIKKPGKFTGLVSALDIAATSVAVANGDTSGKPLDGVNLIPFLNGEQKDSPHKALYWRTAFSSWAVRTETAKYLLSPGTSTPELYDMRTDPFESNNIVEKSDKLKVELSQLWNEWNNDNIGNIWLPAGVYQKRRLEFYRNLHQENIDRAQKKSKLVIK